MYTYKFFYIYLNVIFQYVLSLLQVWNKRLLSLVGTVGSDAAGGMSSAAVEN